MIESNYDEFICRVCGCEEYIKQCSFDYGNFSYHCKDCTVSFDIPVLFSLPKFKVYIRPFKQDGNKLEFRGKIPTKLKTNTDTGFDLYSVQESIINPGEVIKFETNITIIFPKGYGAEVRPRSGFSSQNKIIVINSPGTVDNEYIGDISVPLMNIGKEPYIVKQGERIAQLVIEKVINVKFEEIYDISNINTKRNEDGFNSSGKF